MWSRRITLGTLLLLLVLLVFQDGPAPREQQPELATGPRPPRGLPQPAVVSRQEWRADEDLVRERPHYTGAAKAVFIHHTGNPNDYDCADAPELIRAVQADHVRKDGWDDIGYNFLVDRCGTIYEGRAGGVARSVLGAHTKGFNADTVGIAAIGTFGEGTEVPKPMMDALVELTAWKLRPGVDPLATVELVSTNAESRFDEGQVARLNVISGHRDSYETRCPGDVLYGLLPELRERVARQRAAAPGHAASSRLRPSF
ncbi:peptidoglycan recognition protein [Kitasatospora albolonga]|uniref:Peptidoglycan recognition protein n=2 Tax=Streptomycetaceae TaxID=2062 RepID=A0ABU2WAZ1_9ACTN|nr:peptidoglycan recognition protein [Streptomyces griseus]ARF73624.1 N-acetylmuramoyl-L-alanine amidase [Kitasatospora albolonga]MDT0494491.1 peptidoglycan recognition protein [Streptomyces griseus]